MSSNHHAPFYESHSKITMRLVESALAGASDQQLIDLLGDLLDEVGMKLSAIEIACDVDAETTQRAWRWSRGLDDVALRRSCLDVFRRMLTADLATIRPHHGSDDFMLPPAITDAVAFANHLAPEATLGFFDDVMSLLCTGRRGGFTPGDLALLQKVMPVFALVFGARLNAGAGRNLLETYLGRDSATALLAGRVGLGEVERIGAVVLYCDLANFTSITETLSPQTLIDRLNLFFLTVTGPISRAGGQVSGHVGDAVVMYFPLRDPRQEHETCVAAVASALEALTALDILNRSDAADSTPLLRARIGIDIGEVVHGNVGAPGRFSFTIIGTPVNRAARLQVLAKEVGATLLMTPTLAEASGQRFRSFGAYQLRGFERPVEVFGF